MFQGRWSTQMADPATINNLLDPPGIVVGPVINKFLEGSICSISSAGDLGGAPGTAFTNKFLEGSICSSSRSSAGDNLIETITVSLFYRILAITLEQIL